MIFSWFKNEQKLLPQSGALIEIESERGEKAGTGFSKLKKIERKRWHLSYPALDEKKLKIEMGDILLLLWMDPEKINYCKAEVTDKSSSHLALKRISTIGSHPRSLKTDAVEINVPVHFRSLSTTHLQTAASVNFTPQGLAMITNLQIPTATELYMEVRIPETPAAKFRGNVTESQQLAPGEKKYTTRVDFDKADPEDYQPLLKYLNFYLMRNQRRNVE